MWRYPLDAITGAAQMSQAAHHQEELHAQQELERIYEKIDDTFLFSEDELALIRWAFSISEKK